MFVSIENIDQVQGIVFGKQLNTNHPVAIKYWSNIPPQINKTYSYTPIHTFWNDELCVGVLYKKDCLQSIEERE